MEALRALWYAMVYGYVHFFPFSILNIIIYFVLTIYDLTWKFTALENIYIYKLLKVYSLC